jgi:hypothetical protein
MPRDLTEAEIDRLRSTTRISYTATETRQDFADRLDRLILYLEPHAEIGGLAGCADTFGYTFGFAQKWVLEEVVKWCPAKWLNQWGGETYSQKVFLVRLKRLRQFFQPKRRRKFGTQKPRPLTTRQVEVVEIVGECRGNVAEAARRLGRDRKTIEETYRAALAKLGKSVYWNRNKTRLLTRDCRGQEDVADIDDQRRDNVDEEQQRRFRRR